MSSLLFKQYNKIDNTKEKIFSYNLTKTFLSSFTKVEAKVNDEIIEAILGISTFQIKQDLCTVRNVFMFKMSGTI